MINYSDVIVQCSFESAIDSFDDRWMAKIITGKIVLRSWSEATSDSEEQIGYIHAVQPLWRASSDQLISWADSQCQDFYEAFVWLASLEVDTLNPVYIDRVKLELPYRGQGVGLKAVATFLDLVSPQFVFLKPFPFETGYRDRPVSKSIQRLKLHWKKLGLTEWDGKSQYLWSFDWTAPKKLQPDSRFSAVAPLRLPKQEVS